MNNPVYIDESQKNKNADRYEDQEISSGFPSNYSSEFTLCNVDKRIIRFHFGVKYSPASCPPAGGLSVLFHRGDIFP